MHFIRNNLTNLPSDLQIKKKKFPQAVLYDLNICFRRLARESTRLWTTFAT